MVFGEWIGAIGGGIGGIAGVAAVAVSIWSHRGNQRANRESGEIAERAAAAAADSAESARVSVAEAVKVARIEADREHRALSPGGTVVSFVGEAGRRDDWHVFAVIETERCYRVRAEAVLEGGGTTELGIPLVLHARTPTRVHVELMPHGRELPVAQRIVIRTWPPNAEIDDVEPWTCLCGKVVEDGDGRVGHWQIERSVDYKRPAAPRISVLR